MRWTNSSRLLVGGTTLLALLMVQGISSSRPHVHDTPAENANRLPTKNERLSDENTDIAKVTYQIDEDDNGFQPLDSNLTHSNDLRNVPESDQATFQTVEPDLSDFEPQFESSDAVAVAEPTEAVVATDNAGEQPETGRAYPLPANWQVNPMFDQPMSDLGADDDSVIRIGSTPAQIAAVEEPVVVKTDNTMVDNTTVENNTVENTELENTEMEIITPASRPVSSVLAQISTTTNSGNSANAAPQPPADYYSQGPVGFAVSESVAQKAANHIEYGKSLSRRNATFAARQEFYSALQLVAQAIDTDLAEPSFTRALNEALTALREASDFNVADSESQIGLNTAVIVDTHKSKIVTVDEARSSTPIELMQQYYAFAEDRLILASGRNVVSAEALYSLGKLHSVMSRSDPQADRLDVVKAMVYHRACLECDPSNYRSANELGTLLARNGQMQESKAMLKRSLLISQTPQAWKNLAIVHERMGESELAELARQEYMINLQAPLTNKVNASIQWIDSNKFNATAPVEFHESTAKQPNLPTAPAITPEEPKSEKLIDKVKKWF